MSSIKAITIRRYADLVAEIRGKVRSAYNDIDALIYRSPNIGNDVLPVQILLREAEGRLCSASDILHAIARQCDSFDANGG